MSVHQLFSGTIVRRRRRATPRLDVVMAACCCLAATASAAWTHAAERLTSGDAYVVDGGNRWTLGTADVEKTVALTAGRLVVESFKNKASGWEMTPPGASPEELTPATLGIRSAGPWTLKKSRSSRLSQGELQLELTLAGGPAEITQTYVVHPGSSVVRQWLAVKNVGPTPFVVEKPAFLNLAARVSADPGRVDFLWMTGGENQPGSWMLKTERLPAARPRTFDSYEPFPAAPQTSFPGDGVNAKITVNGRQVWPAKGWQYVANGTVRAPVDVSVDVAAGDRVAFLVNMHGGIGYDTTAFDPTIQYADGEKHVASQEFSGTQGKSGWCYQYLEGGQPVDMVYYPGPKQWRKKIDNATGTPFVGVDDQHPDVGQDAARVWTAPKSGRVRIAAVVCNTGNGGGINPSYGFRMGS